MNQAPRVHVAPRHSKTFGDLAADLAADYGLRPDPWQQVVLDDWLAETGGRWSSLTCGLSVPRQNGKNALIEVRELFGMVGRGEKFLHTAHLLPTARKAFKRLQHFFGTQPDDPGARFPELNALVREIRSANGQEAVILKNGGSIEVVARSKNSARGFTVDVLVMDEAQEMAEEDLEALMPTTSSSPLGNPQWIFTGTPPGPLANGEIFSRVRAEALGGKGKRLSWHEWSAEPGSDLDDRDAWRAVNPALINGRLQFEVIEGERARFSDEGFGRERLGIWDSTEVGGVIPAGAWADRGDRDSVPVGSLSLGIEVAPGLSWAAVSVAGRRADGDWHIELDDDRSTRGDGVGWLVEHVESLVAGNPGIRAVVADVGGPIKSLLDEKRGRWLLRGSDVEITPLKVAELGAGCSTLLAGVVAGGVWHMDQPQLSLAALAATKRDLGDTGMWVWSRKAATTDITPVQSCTYALIGAQMLRPRRPRRSTEKRKVVVRS